MTNPNVLIATPSSGSVKTEYMKCVMAMVNFCSLRGIATSFTSEEGSDVAYQRNVLATRFHETKHFTHLLMIDSDMVFAPDICARLLEKERSVIGTIYPRRTLNFSNIKAALEKNIPFDGAVMFGYDWLSFIPEKTQIEVTDGVVEVNRLGFGIVLIKRYAIDRMVSEGAVRKITRPDASRADPGFNFFSMRESAAKENGHVSEDVSFCDRWRLDCGGKLYALVNVPVFHIADIALGAHFMEYLHVIKDLQSSGRL